jgi:hypothetical protein
MAMPRANARPGTRRQTSAPPEFLLDLDQGSNDLIDTELTFHAGRAQGRLMKDYQKHLEKLCADAAECALISDQATNPEKQHRLQVQGQGYHGATKGGGEGKSLWRAGCK